MQRLLASGINKNISTLLEKFKLRKHVNVYDAKTYVERLFCIKKSTLLAKEMNNKLCGLGVAVLRRDSHRSHKAFVTLDFGKFEHLDKS